jgi:hypothetical protein
MSLRVVINQSNYLTWKGYFDLIHDADLFIFLDNVQFTKNDWRNRNRIKSPNGTFWLTIPVGDSISRRICDVPLPGGTWAKKHMHSLQNSYAGTAHYSAYLDFFEDLYGNLRWTTLSEFNQYIIRTIAVQFLGIKTQFVSSAEFVAPGTSQARVLALLKAAGATTYISGPAAKAYLQPSAFEEAGIELIWKDYSGYPEYAQPHPPFEHAVSIVDLLFCVGVSAPDYIWGWRGSDRSMPR